MAKGGEDAHLLHLRLEGGCVALADGVSGFAAKGVDSGLYSRLLLRNVADALLLTERSLETEAQLEEEAAASAAASGPLGLLTAAHASVHIPGAATAVVVCVDGPRRTLHAVSLGDSGLLVVREGAVVLASTPQQHSFDCPFQLGAVRHQAHTDLPEAAEAYSLPLEEGDLVLVASDGLFDNATVEEILKLVSAAMGDKPGDSPFEAARRVAHSLATHSFSRSQDAQFDSPYAQSSRAEAARRKAETESAGAGVAAGAASLFGALRAAMQSVSPSGEEEEAALVEIGGKTDDITVIAAIVAPAPSRTTAEALKRAEAALLAQRTESALTASVSHFESEGRALTLGESAADAERAALVAKRAAREGAGGAVAEAAGTEGLTAADVEAMEVVQLRKELARRNIPSSGRADTLRQRLLDAL